MQRQAFFEAKRKGKVEKLALLVVGFGGTIAGYREPIASLRATGYDVVAFEYDTTVLSNGDPKALLSLIDTITTAINSLAKGYDELLCTGASLGAYIAFNVQRRLDKAKIGIYATAGISVSHVIFTTRVFRAVKKAFLANGYAEGMLLRAWKGIEILEDAGMDNSKSLLIVMGKRDRIVRYKTASAAMERWRHNGTRVCYFGIPGIGHALTIRWYRHHLDKLLQKHQEAFS